MPINNYFPSLDESGWDNASQSVAVKMLSHFLSSDYSQSYQNYGGVSSLAWLLKEYGKDMSELRSRIAETLRQYYGKYYSVVDVDVVIKDETPNSSKQLLTLHVNLTDSAGVEFTLRQVVETTNNVVTSMDAEKVESHL